jgi:hypothetical protein
MLRRPPPGLLLLLIGCAGAGSGGTPTPAATLPTGIWEFTAVVQGTHRYRNRTEHFSERVAGELRVLTPYDIRIESDHGSCVLHPVSATADETTLRCPGIRLRVRPTSDGLAGEVAVTVREIREERVACEAYRLDSRTGRPTNTCLRWSYSPRQVDVMRSARATFVPAGG